MAANKKTGKGSSHRATRFTGRGLSTKVKTAKGRKSSSTRWLKRQLNDPYVAEARSRGYRSRAAFKLLELNERFHFLKPGYKVLDLGAAPGGWTQVALEQVKAPQGTVVAVDLADIEPLTDAVILKLDIFDADAPEQIQNALGGHDKDKLADVVLSDMAPKATGHGSTDHLRIVGLCEAALDIAVQVLKPGGTFIAKVLQGGTEHQLLAHMKKGFAKVRHAKPPASRSESAEMYVVATEYRGFGEPAAD